MATDLRRSAPRVQFVCSACGAEAPKWQGRCARLRCVEQPQRDSRPPDRPRRPLRVAAAESTPMEEVMSVPARLMPSGSREVNRVLGGGIVPGSVDPARGRSRYRQVDPGPPGRASPRAIRRRRRCTAPARSRWISSRSGRAGSGAQARGCVSWSSRTSTPSSPPSRRSVPRWWWWTRCRRSATPRPRDRRGAFLKFGRRCSA